jgi:hypothetical protein
MGMADDGVRPWMDFRTAIPPERLFDPGHFHGKFIKDPEGPATWRCWCCEEIGYLLDSLLPHPLCERGLRPAIWKVIIPSLCENREISARSLKLPTFKGLFFSLL